MSKIKFTDVISFVGTTPAYFDGEKRYISTGAVDKFSIDGNAIEMITYSNRPSRANLAVRKSDIIFAKMAETLKTLYIDDDLAENIYSTGFCAVRANEKRITPECLYYLVSSPAFLIQKDKHASGATQRAITNSGMTNIVVNVPPLTEQKDCIKKLKTVSLLIAYRKEQLSHLDQLVKSQFIEMFGDVESNSKKWMIGHLGDYMTLLTDFSANGSYELLDSNVTMYDEPNYAVMVRTTDLETDNLQEGIKYIDRKAYDLLSKSKLFGGELIMNKIGSAGKIYIMPFIDKPASLGRNAFMFKFDERLNMTYLYAFLTSNYGTHEIQQYVRGAVTKTITKDSTRRIRILVPPIELQNEFARFVEQTDKSKFKIKQSLEKLETLKKALMQKYFG